MKRLLLSIRDKMIGVKIMLNRSLGYLSLMNAGMIFFLTLSKLKELGLINFSFTKLLIPLYLLGLVCMAFIGYLEMYVFKGYREELHRSQKLVPLHPELSRRLDEIDAQLKDLKTKYL